MLETILLKFIYALNASLALIFVFTVLLYIIDNKDFRTQKNTVLVGFFISISAYYLAYFFYHDLTALETVPNLAFTLISVLSITSLIVIMIQLLLFVTLETNFPYSYLITTIGILICTFLGLFTIVSYLSNYQGIWIHNLSIFSEIGLLSLFVSAELLLIFTIILGYSQKWRPIFFPNPSSTLINHHYLVYFIIGLSLGGISEIFNVFQATEIFHIIGAGISTAGLSIMILIIVKTRYHLRYIAWQIIETQIEELKELDIMKDQFVDVTSHEMRTPLTVIWGNIELLKRDEKEKKMTEQQRMKIFDSIERNYKRIDNLTTEVFDVSRIRRGMFELKLKKVDLRVLIENVVVDMKKYADKTGLSIKTIDDTQDKTKFVKIDANRIDQVLRNLIENAIKFTDKGDIIVTLKDNPKEYIIAIKDQGVGIETERLKDIFDQFKYRESSDPGKEGLGLGLFISKTIIDLHRGEIWVESEGIGKGSSFYFSIPKQN